MTESKEQPRAYRLLARQVLQSPGVHASVRNAIRPYVHIVPAAHHAALSHTWTVHALCQAYNWPAGLPGGGVIAIVELGGGWVESDLKAYFTQVNEPLPTIVDVSVDGTTNAPVAGNDSPDYEVALDIQVAASAYYAATKKAASIRVYWSQDIASAVAAAAADGCDVCSISWGANETDWGRAAAAGMESAAKAATAKGMTIFAASGDNDSSDGGKSNNVDLPASAPHVIGCGGTSKTTLAETVWNNNPGNRNGEGTGGGYSRFFPVQPWQLKAPAGSGRMVPDVAANADPNTGYNIYVHGAAAVVGGTSAVAPLYSGLFAAFGVRGGFVSPKLWSNAAAFHDITQGNNGAYHAVTGPDPCTGLGSPVGTKIAVLTV